MTNFATTPLYLIEKSLQKELAQLQPHGIITFVATNPDLASSTYNGTRIYHDDKELIYRGYKTWIDLAHTLGCRMLTPMMQDLYYVTIRFQKLSNDSFHSEDADIEQKYGAHSIFSKINKNEESSFVHTYMQALEKVSINSKKHILNLGINSADEFELICELFENSRQIKMSGVDFCASAIQTAKERFSNYTNISLYQHDITQLETLQLPKADLIISIGTLQSSNLNFNEVLMDLVQNHLHRDGAMILGFPNCRWRDGEMLYGAKMRNYNYSEMSNLYKDVYFAKKYLQQKKFRVTITGKDYIFVTATSIKT